MSGVSSWPPARPSAPALARAVPRCLAPAVSLDFRFCLRHTGSFRQATGYFPPRSKLLEARRPDDKSNWRAAPVTELCKMKALQILPGRGATPAPSAGWAGRGVTALIGSVFDPCRLREVGEVPPVPWDRDGATGRPRGAPGQGTQRQTARRGGMLS